MKASRARTPRGVHSQAGADGTPWQISAQAGISQFEGRSGFATVLGLAGRDASRAGSRLGGRRSFAPDDKKSAKPADACRAVRPHAASADALFILPIDR